MTEPIRIKPARAWRTYLGGKLIDELHGDSDATDTNFPEEWLMSTVRARNSGREDIIEGLSFTEDGRALSELVTEPLGVLVKLLDSAERLTVQVHPTKKAARELFDSEYGKTECWHIIGTRELDGEKPCIYLGFREGITREYWKACFDRQDIPSMLGCLHKVEVKVGETYLIHGGVPHAIGAGCFLVEIQEPTDYTVRTERVTPSGLGISDFMCHQGLGFERMFDCFEYGGASLENTLAKYRLSHEPTLTDSAKITSLVGYSDTPLFRLEKYEIDGEFAIAGSDEFSGLYILSGEGMLDGKPTKVGDQYFLPRGCRGFALEGKLTAIRCFGPKGDTI